MNLRIRLLAPLALVALSSIPTGAQQSNIASADSASPAASAGWLFTPSVGWATTWDDNVLLRGKGDQQLSDQTTVLSPGVRLDYGGKRNQLDIDYSGAFLLYRQFDTLDTFDQRGTLYARHAITPHIALFVHDSIARTPSTELSEFVGVPFVATGSFVEDARGGVEAALSAHTSLTASYHVQFVSFDGTFAPQLFGGHSQGATASARHRLSEKTTIVADYDYQHATVAGGFGIFDIQNGEAGVEQRVTAYLRVYGMAGIAQVGASSFGPAHVGPAMRAGVSRDFRAGGIDVSYSRAFAPSYGFGGTMQSDDFTARLRVPLGHHLSGSSAVSWRNDDALTAGALNLRSIWVEASIAYAFERWLQIAGFYASSQQTIDVAGGEIGRQRFGIQIITTTPMRLR